MLSIQLDDNDVADDDEEEEEDDDDGKYLKPYDLSIPI